MKKNMKQAFIIISCAMFVVGCKTTGVQVKSYIENRPRVDQQISGNAGYLYGTPKAEDLKKGKPTRKMLVVEVTKPADKVPDKEYQVYEDIEQTPEPKEIFKEPVQKKKVEKSLSQKINIPSFDDMDETSPAAKPPAVKYVEYKVEKNDTLQKISKKFYDSYSKWPKIYEANKDRIKNPDSITPGITIMIPVEK